MRRAALIVLALPLLVVLGRMQQEGRAALAQAEASAARSDAEAVALRVRLLGRAARLAGG